MPIPKLKVTDLRREAIDLLKEKAIRRGRLTEEETRVDLVFTKYLKALIFYDGIQRVEQFMFHQNAFREILLNAIVHKDYSSCNPIQISVYEDKIYIWNDSEMPSRLN